MTRSTHNTSTFGFGETRGVATCPNCAKELPGDFPFCPYCAAPLGATAPASIREERKVVSVLFCDLVGFTAASEHADPEDVRARLRPYHAQLQRVIDSHGGTVEKTCRTDPTVVANRPRQRPGPGWSGRARGSTVRTRCDVVRRST